MIINFEKMQSPIINTEHGKAYIVRIDLSSPYLDIDGRIQYPTEKATRLWVRVIYNVVDHEWHSSNFMGGLFQLTFISRILKDFEINAKINIDTMK